MYAGILISSNIYGIQAGSEQINNIFNNILNNSGKYTIFMIDYPTPSMINEIISKNFI